MRRPATRPAVLSLVVVLVAVLWVVTFASVSARAFWSASSSAPASGAAAVGSLNRPAAPTAVALASSVTLTWTASTRADGGALTGYTVQRYDAGGVAQAVGGTCAGTVAGLTCTETGVADGTWRYAITPVLGAWTGTQSPLATVVTVDTVAPTLGQPVATATSGTAYQSGATVWFRGVAAGGLTLTSTVADAGSGPAGARTTALGGTTPGWTHNPGLVTSPSGGPYVSNPFAWAAGTTGTATTTVTGVDGAGNLSTPRTVSFVDDSAAPVGATLLATTGATTASSVTLTLGTVTDAGSGLASRTLFERAATLTGNTCGTFTAWSAVAAVTTPTLDRTIAYGTCYDYSYVVVDNLGNSSTVSLVAPIKNRSYAAEVAATTGILDYYRLGGTSSTSISDSSTIVSTNDGTCAGGPSVGQTGAITGDSDTAFAFDGVDDGCSVTRAVAGSFSLELWMSPGAGGTGNGAWANGAGLVTTNVGLLAATDFGVTYMQDKHICAGIGALTTICSSATYAGGWHHVVFTRNAVSGALVLYVDGASVASTTGSLDLLNINPSVRLGSLRSSGNVFKGSLDEVAVYTVPLSAATVAQHYQSGTG